MIERTLLRHLQALARRYPVLTITGPRQSGKTTLSRMAFRDKAFMERYGDVFEKLVKEELGNRYRRLELK